MKAERNADILQMHHRGFSINQIAGAHGLTRQRIVQIIRAARHA